MGINVTNLANSQAKPRESPAEQIENLWSSMHGGTIAGSHDSYQVLLGETDPAKRQADANKYATDLAYAFKEDYGDSAGDRVSEFNAILTDALTSAQVTPDQLASALQVADSTLATNAGSGSGG